MHAAHIDAMDILKMDIQERSFMVGMKRHLAAGRSVNALVYVKGDPPLGVPPLGVSIEGPQYGRAYTLLYYAVGSGWCPAITWLIKNGADVDAGEPRTGMTPLHRATRQHGSRDADAAERLAPVLLLDAGARVDERDLAGRTALHYAVESENEETCKLILSRGASLDLLPNYYFVPGANIQNRRSMATATFLAKVRAAGGWDKYVHEPRAELLALRRELPSLRERGRASPSTVRAHERLFLNTSLPDEAFSHILAFWRTSRDYSRCD